jgi:uncharacterized protein (TIGR03437 family)
MPRKATLVASVMTMFIASAAGPAHAQTLTPNSWTMGTPMPTARTGAFTGVIGTKIYVIGGANSNAALNVNEIYDTSAGTWSTGAPMPTARSLGGSAVVNNILYAIAGGNSNGPLTVVEAYDPASDSWSTKAPVPLATDSVYSIVDNGIIYLVGGCCAPGGMGVRFNYLQAYNPSTNVWSVMAPMNVQKSQAALGVFGSMLVSAGGLLQHASATTDNEGYNPSTNSWQTLAPLPDARVAGCSESLGNVLYFAGGTDVGGGSGNPKATMDAYHADTNSWSTGLPSMPYATVNVASASVGGSLYCFGGWDNRGSIYNYLQIYQPSATPPSISDGGVVSASGFGEFSSIAPGTFIEIYGSNLAGDTRGWTGADFSGINAPTSLDGTSVSIGGQAAFVNYISPGQVNVLVPSSLAAGQQPLTVMTAAGTSNTYTVNVNSVEPGLLAPSNFKLSGNQYAVALFADGSYVLPAGAIAGLNSRPAQPGDIIVLYGIGFGPVTPYIPAGQLVGQANTLADSFTIDIGGVPATVEYDGLAPDFTGLYQFNIKVPNAPAGNAVPLTFSVNNVPGTQTLYLAIGN